MSHNETRIASNWAGYRRIWIIIALILLALLILLWAMGYGPNGKKCVVSPTIIEKVIEVEKQVDNPKLLSRISLLESDNKAIAGLKAKITALQSVAPTIIEKRVEIEKRVDNPDLLKQIDQLKQENQAIEGLKQRIKKLDQETQSIPGLKSRLQELKQQNQSIQGLQDKIKTLENAEPKVIEKIVEKIIEVPVAPVAPSAPIAPVMAPVLPETAKLYFGFGSAIPPAVDNIAMTRLISHLRDNPKSVVLISGFHDASGDRAANQQLSMQRAQEVAKRLLQSGVTENQIMIEKPAETTGTGSAREARRVEVKLRR